MSSDSSFAVFSHIQTPDLKELHFDEMNILKTRQRLLPAEHMDTGK